MAEASEERISRIQESLEAKIVANGAQVEAVRLTLDERLKEQDVRLQAQDSHLTETLAAMQAKIDTIRSSKGCPINDALRARRVRGPAISSSENESSGESSASSPAAERALKALRERRRACRPPKLTYPVTRQCTAGGVFSIMLAALPQGTICDFLAMHKVHMEVVEALNMVRDGDLNKILRTKRNFQLRDRILRMVWKRIVRIKKVRADSRLQFLDDLLVALTDCCDSFMPATTAA